MLYAGRVGEEAGARGRGVTAGTLNYQLRTLGARLSEKHWIPAFSILHIEFIYHDLQNGLALEELAQKHPNLSTSPGEQASQRRWRYMPVFSSVLNSYLLR